MKKMSFIKDYKDNHILRKSYCELANNIFGIDFNEYYEKGFWSNKYVPFSYVYENQVIANVSVNILDLIVRGEKKKALQIGTVMTDLNYRKQGLATDLMNKVLDDYRDSYDFMYLFANKNVLDFYPKFGFSVVEENEFYIDFSSRKYI
ncbi:GNAT family N-acetyltransferase [Bacillus megaterium]|nr:GNAT family N-acetyltransferase [Priestia megaterium]